jgi:hypothetical protein
MQTSTWLYFAAKFISHAKHYKLSCRLSAIFLITAQLRSRNSETPTHLREKNLLAKRQRAQGKNLCARQWKSFHSLRLRHAFFPIAAVACVSQIPHPAARVGGGAMHPRIGTALTQTHTSIHPSIHSIRARLFFLPLIACASAPLPRLSVARAAAAPVLSGPSTCVLPKCEPRSIEAFS